MRQVLSITLVDGRQIAGLTCADSRSSYGQPVFRIEYDVVDIGEKFLLTLEGQEALPAMVVWEDEGWLIYQPDGAHPCGAIHKESGLVSGLSIDEIPVEDLCQEMDTDGDMAAWISDLVKERRMRADETVTDWTGQTIGLILY